MEEGSLEDHLYAARGGSERSDNSKNVPASFLDWPTRAKIALGTASGLAYLHEVSEWLWIRICMCLETRKGSRNVQMFVTKVRYGAARHGAVIALGTASGLALLHRVSGCDAADDGQNLGGAS
jgi:hypothetical protein